MSKRIGIDTSSDAIEGRAVPVDVSAIPTPPNIFDMVAGIIRKQYDVPVATTTAADRASDFNSIFASRFL